MIEITKFLIRPALSCAGPPPCPPPPKPGVEYYLTDPEKTPKDGRTYHSAQEVIDQLNEWFPDGWTAQWKQEDILEQ